MANDYKEWNERRYLLSKYHWKYTWGCAGAKNGYIKQINGKSILLPVCVLKSIDRSEFETLIGRGES